MLQNAMCPDASLQNRNYNTRGSAESKYGPSEPQVSTSRVGMREGGHKAIV